MQTLFIDSAKGLNVRRTFCPHCGQDSGKTRMMGAYDYIVTCPECKLERYGGGSDCLKCGTPLPRKGPLIRKLGPDEKVPGPACPPCQRVIDLANETVKRGGVFVACKSCGGTFVAQAQSPIAKDARQKLKCPAPKPCTIEVSRCPKCPRRP